MKIPKNIFEKICLIMQKIESKKAEATNQCLNLRDMQVNGKKSCP